MFSLRLQRVVQVLLILLSAAFVAVAAASGHQGSNVDQEWVRVARETSDALSPAERQRASGLFRQAFELFRSGELGAAERLFVRGLQTDPANATAHFYLGEVYARQSKADLAHAHYERARMLEPDSKEGALAEDRIALLQSKKSQAEAAARKAEEERLNQATVYFIRKHRHLGSAGHYTLREESRGIVARLPGGRDVVDVYRGPPGRIVIFLETNFGGPPDGPFTFTLNARSAHYIQAVTTFSHVNLRLLSNEDGRALVEGIAEPNKAGGN